MQMCECANTLDFYIYNEKMLLFGFVPQIYKIQQVQITCTFTASTIGHESYWAT